MYNKGDIVSGHTIIYDPVSVYDVSKVIRKASQDVGTLCGAGATYVNKWAKYKPVVYANLLDTTSQLNTTASSGAASGVTFHPWLASATWWKGSAGMCGLQFPTQPADASTSDENKRVSGQTTSAQLDNEATNLDNWFKTGVQYLSPAGGTSAPYRLIDFQLYDRDAQCFITSVTFPRSDRPYYAGDGAETASLSVTLHTPSAYELGMNDITIRSGQILGDYYLGLIIVKNSGGTSNRPLHFKYWVTTEGKKLNASGGTTLTLSLSDLSSLIDDRNIRTTQGLMLYPALFSSPVYKNQASGVYGLSVFGTQSNATIDLLPNITVPSTMMLYPNAVDSFMRINGKYESGSLTHFQIQFGTLNFWQSSISVTHLEVSITTKNVTYTTKANGSGGSSGSLQLLFYSDWYSTPMTLPQTMVGTNSAGSWSYTDPAGDKIFYVDCVIDTSLVGSTVVFAGKVYYQRNGVDGVATAQGFTIQE